MMCFFSNAKIKTMLTKEVLVVFLTFALLLTSLSNTQTSLFFYGCQGVRSNPFLQKEGCDVMPIIPTGSFFTTKALESCVFKKDFILKWLTILKYYPKETKSLLFFCKRLLAMHNENTIVRTK